MADATQHRIHTQPFFTDLLVLRLIAASVLLALFTGCSAEVRTGLDRDAAQAIASALMDEGIDAQTRPAGRGTFSITVPNAQRTEAEQLIPRAEAEYERKRALEAALGSASLIPTPTEERSRRAHLLGESLALSLRDLPRVEEARVHVVLPESVRFRIDSAERPSPSAAVLVSHLGTDPVDESKIRQLLQGAVPDLSAEAIAIVQSPREGRRLTPEPMASVGPIVVPKSSLPTLQAVLGTALSINIALAVCLLYLLRRKPGHLPST